MRRASRGLNARGLVVRAVLLALPCVLAACETLPGFGATQPAPVTAVRSPLIAPPPPPPRPRAGATAGHRFRVDPSSSASAEPATAPVPPPAPTDAAAPTIRAESQVAPPPPPLPAPGPPPALAGDSAATEVARAEPAATPLAPPPAPPPPPSIDPASMRGKTATELRDRFGAPASQTPIASGMSWHYERAGCKATFVMLPELTSGALRVFSYEITPGEGAMFGPAGCLGRLAATRGGRTAGTAP